MFKTKREKNFNLSKNLKKTFKNKRITNEEKVSLMIKDFCYYFENKLKNDANMATYELYYERFMIDDNHKHNLIYKKFYDYEYQNLLYVYFVDLNQYFTKLNENFDVKKINSKEKEIFNDVLLFSKRCHFCENFDYTRFYYNEAIREMIVKNMQVIEKHFEANSKSSDDLFGF